MRKWNEVARDLRVAAKRVDFYIGMGLADIIEAQALDALDKACVDFLRHCHEQWLAHARAKVEETATMKDEELPKDEELLNKTWDCYEVCKEESCPAWRHIHSNERLDMAYWWKIRRLCFKENKEATK